MNSFRFPTCCIQGLYLMRSGDWINLKGCDSKYIKKKDLSTQIMLMTSIEDVKDLE